MFETELFKFCKVLCVAGYSCCPPQHHICDKSPYTQCYPPGLPTQPACCMVAKVGVAPSAYKKMCQAGFIWVEWKRRCMRRN